MSKTEYKCLSVCPKIHSASFHMSKNMQIKFYLFSDFRSLCTPMNFLIFYTTKVAGTKVGGITKDVTTNKVDCTNVMNKLTSRLCDFLKFAPILKLQFTMRPNIFPSIEDTQNPQTSYIAFFSMFQFHYNKTDIGCFGIFSCKCSLLKCNPLQI